MSEIVRAWTNAGRRRMRTVSAWGRQIWRDWWKLAAFIILAVVPVKSSLADWNWVPTGSMNPTILEGDLIYVDKLAYGLRVPLTLHRLASWSEPQRGEVVVCLSPADGTRLVKRVVGTPGDTVQMRGDVLLLNGRPLAYHFTGRELPVHLPGAQEAAGIVELEDLGRTTHPVVSIPGIRARRSFGPVVVPEGHYFLMGDNRDLSRDSRHFGMVPREAILGRACAVILSFDITDKYQPRIARFLTPLR
jgi:signal peptidase I